MCDERANLKLIEEKLLLCHRSDAAFRASGAGWRHGSDGRGRCVDDGELVAGPAPREKQDGFRQSGRH